MQTPSSISDTVKIINTDLLLRLKNYMKGLRILAVKGRTETSISSLADFQHIDVATIRQDFSLLGFSDGVREIFSVGLLLQLISNCLGYYRVEEACLVGCGRLARTLLADEGFCKCNIRIVAAFDINPLLVNTEIAGVRVLSTLHFNDIIHRMNVVLAIMATPSKDTQVAADIICNSSIKMLWNFTHRSIEIPKGIVELQSSLASDICEDYTSLIALYKNSSSLLSI